MNAEERANWQKLVDLMAEARRRAERDGLGPGLLTLGALAADRYLRALETEHEAAKAVIASIDQFDEWIERTDTSDVGWSRDEHRRRYKAWRAAVEAVEGEPREKASDATKDQGQV